MNKEIYFGKSNENNISLLKEYLDIINDSLKENYDFGKPFFKYDNKVNFYQFLKEKNLNLNPLSPEETFSYISNYFKNLPNWINPGTMINVIPPVNLISLAASSVANMYNPNLAQDTYSGLIILSELEVVKYLSELVGWDWLKSHGTFTFGGKGTNLYATKVALNKVDKNISKTGCNGNYFMLTSKNGHPCHYEVCNWLGIGTDNCYEVECNDDGTIDLNAAKKIIEKNIESGRIFIGINLTGGSTNELIVDPIFKVSKMIDSIVKKYDLNYKPHIHVDAVLGWVYLFFKEYNFEKNELNIPIDTLNKIKNMSIKIGELKYADSIGIDFHKTGFCPYLSSVIIFKNKDDYYTLCENDNIDFEQINFGSYNPYHSTLELTRASSGPISALCSLKSLGIKGYQKIFSDLFLTTEYFRKKIKEIDDFILINEQTEGIASLFVLKPKEYSNLEYDDIYKLDLQTANYIQKHNSNFANFILKNAINREIDFVFTSSRSYVLQGTNIKIGALKAYPMSPFLTCEKIDEILVQLKLMIKKFENSEKSNNSLTILDNMVYRDN